MRHAWMPLAAALFAGTLAAQFEQPTRIAAGGEDINVDIGHAAPFAYDFDGDGVRDLLVGQFGEGKLRVYRNEGTDKAPKYGKFEWFMAGGEIAKIPAS
ncbi:MAG: VCBS repeat-containing protein [Planctomycetes bacterium]|nr:VCBS repeat-containing protein [Planctomycetota bacterium]